MTIIKKEPLIRSDPFFRQQCSFQNLTFGKRRPTDIDAFYEVNDDLYIFFEAKFKGKGMGEGQDLALTRVCDACQSEDRDSFLIISEHETPPPEFIDLGNSKVVKVRYKQRWSDKHKGKTVREVFELICNWKSKKKPTN